jgi:hypothetical protein
MTVKYSTTRWAPTQGVRPAWAMARMRQRQPGTVYMITTRREASGLHHQEDRALSSPDKPIRPEAISSAPRTSRTANSQNKTLMFLASPSLPDGMCTSGCAARASQRYRGAGKSTYARRTASLGNGQDARRLGDAGVRLEVRLDAVAVARGIDMLDVLRPLTERLPVAGEA